MQHRKKKREKTMSGEKCTKWDALKPFRLCHDYLNKLHPTGQSWLFTWRGPEAGYALHSKRIRVWSLQSQFYQAGRAEGCWLSSSSVCLCNCPCCCNMISALSHEKSENVHPQIWRDKRHLHLLPFLKIQSQNNSCSMMLSEQIHV